MAPFCSAGRLGVDTSTVLGLVGKSPSGWAIADTYESHNFPTSMSERQIMTTALAACPMKSSWPIDFRTQKANTQNTAAKIAQAPRILERQQFLGQKMQFEILECQAQA